MAYLLDSNVFIQAKNLHYGFDFCPAFWTWMKVAHGAGTIFSVDAVRNELVGTADQLGQWAKDQAKSFFQAVDSATVASMQTVAEWVRIGSYKQAAVAEFLSVADFYLVAHAHAHNFVVVTHEKFAVTPNKVKIPNVCKGLGVRCISPFEMLRQEDARFILGVTKPTSST